MQSLSNPSHLELRRIVIDYIYISRSPGSAKCQLSRDPSFCQCTRALHNVTQCYSCFRASSLVRILHTAITRVIKYCLLSLTCANCHWKSCELQYFNHTSNYSVLGANMTRNPKTTVVQCSVCLRKCTSNVPCHQLFSQLAIQLPGHQLFSQLASYQVISCSVSQLAARSSAHDSLRHTSLSHSV